MDTVLFKRLMPLRTVPPHIIVITAIASYTGQIVVSLHKWPLWAIVLVTLLPWLPLFIGEMVWTYRHYQWLALFYLLVIIQGGHFLEHVAQIYQIHILGLQGLEARGIIGPLDIEWVHVIFNTWVLLAVLTLLLPFRANPWLWPTLLIAGWHEIEHLYIITIYLSTGQAGTPGLLSQGGVLGGGLPLKRPDLHFWYNLLETTPLLIAFIYQLKRSYDEWLARAFPDLPEALLIEATNRLQTVRFAAGETVIRQGDTADRFYIITQGQANVIHHDQEGQEIQVATLGRGQFFGEIGLLTHGPRIASVKAKTALETLALDQETFRQMVDSSAATAESLAQVMRQRMPTVTERGLE